MQRIGLQLKVQTITPLKISEKILRSGVDCAPSPIVNTVRVLVKVRSVPRASEWGDYRGRDLFLNKKVKVEALEPLVFLDVLRAVLEVSIALGAVGLEQLLDKILRMGIEMARVINLARENLLIDAERILIIKRRIPKLSTKSANTIPS
jgi:hypothetical protein